MKKANRVLWVILALTMAIFLVACTNDSDNVSQQEPEVVPSDYSAEIKDPEATTALAPTYDEPALTAPDPEQEAVPTATPPMLEEVTPSEFPEPVEETESIKDVVPNEENGPADDVLCEEPEPVDEHTHAEEIDQGEEDMPAAETLPIEVPDQVVNTCISCDQTDDLTMQQVEATEIFLCQTCCQNLKTAARCYANELSAVSDFYTNYGLYDIDSDGVPELFIDQGIAVHSVAPGEFGSRWIFESMIVLTMYVDPETHQMLAGYQAPEGTVVDSHYYLYEMRFGELIELEVRWSSQDEAYEETLDALINRMYKVESKYTIGDENTVFEDLCAALADIHGDL